MTSPDPQTSPRRAARAEAERRATAAISLPPTAAASLPSSRSASTAASPSPVAGPPTASPRDATAVTRRQLRAASASVVPRRRRLSVVAAVVAVVVAGGIAIGAASANGGGDAVDLALDQAPAAVMNTVPSEGLPVPSVQAVPATASLCDDPAFTDALAAGDDGGAIAAAGGGESFRRAVATGLAPCVSLSDPTREWAVVNKQRPYDPIDWRPGDLVAPAGMRALEDTAMRTAAAEALTALASAARDAGAGEIAYLSAFRSYTTQQSTYAARVSVGGVAQADLESARPGFSEHQSGLAVDIVPCSGSCGTLDDVAGSPQGAWVREHAWEYGYITRYVEGRTDVTGYEPEAWHLRYIGPELAAAYHDGGYTTLEEFFGLPAAPSY